MKMCANWLYSVLSVGYEVTFYNFLPFYFHHFLSLQHARDCVSVVKTLHLFARLHMPTSDASPSIFNDCHNALHFIKCWHSHCLLCCSIYQRPPLYIACNAVTLFLQLFAP